MDLNLFKTTGFVPVEYPLALRMDVMDAADRYKDFCGLPLKEKLRFSRGDRSKDFGYMLRDDDKDTADKKEVFEFQYGQLGEFRRTLSGVKSSPAREFIEQVAMLIDGITPFVWRLARATEERYRVVGLERAIMDARRNWIFRFLRYPHNKKALAQPHIDKGMFTLHLYESEGGGEYLGFDRVWRPWPISDRQTVVFPSLLIQHLSRCLLKALCHRVLPLPETERDERFAIVMFIDAIYDRWWHENRRTQDYPPGFNYSMPFGEFNRLFVRR